MGSEPSAAARGSPKARAAEGLLPRSAHANVALPPAWAGSRRRRRGPGPPRGSAGTHGAASLRAWPRNTAEAARPPRPTRPAQQTSLLGAEPGPPAIRPSRSGSRRPVPKWPPTSPSVFSRAAGGNNSETDPRLGEEGDRRRDRAGRRG